MATAALVGEVLERSGLSKKTLCEAAGISRSSLDAYLKGEREPSVAQLERLGRAAGLRLDISWTSIEIDARLEPSWILPDNPAMRAVPLTIEQRAQALARVVASAWALQRRPRGSLEAPRFRDLARSA